MPTLPPLIIRMRSAEFVWNISDTVALGTSMMAGPDAPFAA
jgi:hypothetical protein